MSNKRNDISQINKYLQGKLDNKAMHQLERDAQDDPFLMDALAGYESAKKDQQENLNELQTRLAKRVSPEKQRAILLWRVLPIAASVLLMIGAAYWYFKPGAAKIQYANIVKVDSVEKAPDVIQPNNKTAQGQPAKIDHPKKTVPAYAYPKTDTTDIHRMVVKKGEKLEDLLEKMKALEIDSNDYIAKNNKSLTKLHINDKDYTGGNAKEALKKLPADVVAKIHIIDDYGDQAKLTKPIAKSNTFGNSAKTPVDSIKIKDAVAGLNIKNNTGAPGMRGSVNTRGLSVIDSSKQAAMPNSPSKKYITVTGEVKDIYGQAMEGATIGAAGKGLTQVDANGKFTVTIPADINTLVATNIGYKSQIIKIDKQSNLAIKLSPDNRSLSEVVIRGYVKRNRDETTGSSYIVTGRDAKKPANTSPVIVGGKIPGKFLPLNPAAETKPTINSTCNENPRFKKGFFAAVAIVQKHTEEKLSGSGNTVSYKQFLKALNFIAKYTKVSINIEKGSNAEYLNKAAFDTDRDEWVDWYDDNKCKGLK